MAGGIDGDRTPDLTVLLNHPCAHASPLLVSAQIAEWQVQTSGVLCNTKLAYGVTAREPGRGVCTMHMMPPPFLRTQRGGTVACA